MSYSIIAGFRLLSSSSTGVNMNADIARWIVDRYNAWQKIPLDVEDLSQDDKDRKKGLEEETFRRLQEVIQLGSLLRADNQRVEGKIGKDGLSRLSYLNLFSSCEC